MEIPLKAIVYSSLRFGVWHVKNVFYLDTFHLVYQILYATLIIGPIFGWIALKTRTLWIGVILHYVNNILAPLSFAILSELLKVGSFPS